MKRSEIKVGEEYASTRSRDWTRWWDAKRVRVVDLGPFAEANQHIPRMVDVGIIDGTPTKDNYRRDPKGTYVAVRYIGDDFEPEGRVRFVSVTQLKTTWTDYLEAKAATLKARSEGAARDAKRRQEVTEDCATLAVLAAQLNLRSDKPGPAWRFDPDGQVVMTRDHFRALLNAALAPSQPAEEATP